MRGSTAAHTQHLLSKHVLGKQLPTFFASEHKERETWSPKQKLIAQSHTVATYRDSGFLNGAFIAPPSPQQSPPPCASSPSRGGHEGSCPGVNPTSNTSCQEHSGKPPIPGGAHPSGTPTQQSLDPPGPLQAFHFTPGLWPTGANGRPKSTVLIALRWGYINFCPTSSSPEAEPELRTPIQ